MDISKMLLTGDVALLKPLEQIKKNDFQEGKTEQFAKDFESVFIAKLLDAMKGTIGDWGFEKDGTSEQVQGIFWTYLSQDLANSGGFGMWKNIYQSLADSENNNSVTGLVDKHL